MSHHDALARYADLFERVSPADIPQLDQFFTDDARFKDPFNDVRGIDAIRHVFERMFETCLDVDFRVHDRFVDGDSGCLTWTLRFRPNIRGYREQTWRIEGASRIRFDGDGRIAEHVDYWDSGEYFYLRLPVIGRIIAFIRNRVG